MPSSRAASLSSRFNPLITHCIQIMTRRKFAAGFIFREAERDECKMGYRKGDTYGEKYEERTHRQTHEMHNQRSIQNHTRTVDHTRNTQLMDTQGKQKKRTYRNQTRHACTAKHTKIALTENQKEI